MSHEDKRSRPIYRKGDIDIDGRDYAIDLYEGELPPLSEGDKVILRDRAGLYNLLLVEKEDTDDKRCDKDHHYCHKHNRCERIDHDCDDKDHPPHDPDLDRRILDDVDYQTKLLKDIQSDIRNIHGGSDGDLDRRILEISETAKRILQDVDADSDKGLDLDRKILNSILSLTNVCNTILSILQNAPPPPPIPIPPPPPTPSPSPPPPSPSPPPPPPKEQSHTRVIIQGEFDVPHDEITEENKPEDPVFQRQLVEKFVNIMKKENPDFKITKTLVARGIGPVKVAW